MSEKNFVKVEVKDGDDSVKEVSVYIKRPTNSVISAADKYKAKIWNQCLMDGILTKLELSRLMIERGIWSDSKNDEQESIMKEITRLEKDLYLGKGGKRKVSEGKNIAIEIRKLRIKLRDLLSEKIGLEENTAESISENAKFDFLVSECTFYDNNEKVYESIDDYNSKSSDEISFTAASKLAEMMYSLDSNFEKNLPENKWLNKFGLVDDDLHIINKEKEKVDIEGRRVNDNGNYLNDKDELVDKDGNLLEEDGTYVLQVEYQEDEVKKRSRKRTVKAGS